MIGKANEGRIPIGDVKEALNFCKNCIDVSLKKTEIIRKRGRGGPYIKEINAMPTHVILVIQL